MGIGSAVLALAVAALPVRFALRWRWLVFAAVLATAALASALTLAQALASAFTGAVAESVSVQAAMLIPGCAGVVVLLLGVANVAIEQRALARRVHAHA